MLGIGLGLQKGGLILSVSDAQVYAKAAEAAGGTVESISCVKASFDALNSISLPEYRVDDTSITVDNNLITADNG